MGCPNSRNMKNYGDDSIYLKKKKILILGPQGSGKTQIFNILMNKEYNECYRQTEGVNTESFKYEDTLYMVFDIGGQMQSLWSYYYESTSAVIFVIDVNDKQQFLIAKQQFSSLSQSFANSDLQILIMLNKIDLNPNFDINFLIYYLDINDNDLDIFIKTCSAKTLFNVNQAFQKLDYHIHNNHKSFFQSSFLNSNQQNNVLYNNCQNNNINKDNKNNMKDNRSKEDDEDKNNDINLSNILNFK